MKKNKIVFSLLVTVLLCTFLYLKKAHRRVNPEWALLNIEALALGEDPTFIVLELEVYLNNFFINNLKLLQNEKENFIGRIRLGAPCNRRFRGKQKHEQKDSIK